MSSAVLLTTSSVRTLNLFKLKKEKYDLKYITVLSLKSMLNNRLFNVAGGEFTGEINSYYYSIKYRPLESRRTFITSESSEATGNYGSYQMTLYLCKLQLSNKNTESSSEFQILKYKKIITHE